MSDRRMQRGQQWLEKLLTLAKYPAQVSAEVGTPATQEDDSLDESDSYWLTIDHSQLSSIQIQTLIGTNGVVLDAIQYLANSTLNMSQDREEQASYTIELNGYRIARQTEIQAIANAAAQQVRQIGQEVEIKSLSSAERRQIHTFLKDEHDLETFSRGQEPDRRLVIKLRSN